MAPAGRQRSRRRPRAVAGALLETRKQQSCEAAALRVTAARLTRPAERCFRNQRESFRASRNAEPGPGHLRGRLERDLLNLVRGEERARPRRSPSPPPPPRRSRSSRERHHGRSGNKRAALRSPSLLSSSSDASQTSRGRRHRRRKSHRRRSRWSSSSGDEDGVIVVPVGSVSPSRAPLSGNREAVPPPVRASLERAVNREFVTPANAAPTRGAGVSSGGSFGRPDTPKERRERLIVSRCVAELHKSLDKKRKLLRSGTKSVLSNVRSYLLDVAREARSSLGPEADILWSGGEGIQDQDDVADTEFIPDAEAMQESEEIPDPDLIPEPPEITDPELIPESEEVSDPDFIPEPEEMPDPEFIPETEEVPDPELIPEPLEVTDPELIPEAEEISDAELIPEPQEITDPELLPSPEPMADAEPDVLSMEESELPSATPATSLLRDSLTSAGEKRRQEEQRAEEDEERYEQCTRADLWRSRPVSSTSSFLVTWGDDQARAAAWQPPPPPPQPPLLPTPPPVVLDPMSGLGRWRDRGLLPTPLLPVRTVVQGHYRSWREEADQPALPRPSQRPWSSEERSTSWPDCRRPPPPPQRTHPHEALPWLRTCEELLPYPEPAEWRGARRCFSPSADYPPMNFHFNRRPHQQRRFPTPEEAARHNSEIARRGDLVDSRRWSRREMF